MTSKKEHYCFQPPADENVKIWRCMDFTKYVSLLSSETLYFSRSDRFGDPYEGATSHANTSLRQNVYKDKPIPKEMLEKYSIFAEWVRQWTYINCWHMNEYESAAMWKLYARIDEAVAIQSTYRKLKNCLSKNVLVGVVHYIDYETQWLPEGNTRWPFVHKRKSFEHERELRALIQDIPSKDKFTLTGMSNNETGKTVPIDLNGLIESVLVFPNSPKWFSGLVKEITSKYKFSFEVRYSLLAKSPVY